MITPKNLWILLGAGLTILCTSTANAQWADRGTLARMSAGVAAGRVATSPVGSPGRAGLRPDKAASTPNPKALIGSWLETVTFPPEVGRPPLKSLVNFHGDETMATSDAGSVTTDPPSVFSSGQGAWAHQEKRTFAYTILELISDLSGNLIGYLKVTGIYTVSESGNEYTGTSFAEVSGTDGNVFLSFDVTNAGRRIQVDLP